MKLDIYNQKGNKLSKKVELNKDVFGIDPSEHSVYLAIKSELASRRQGTSKSKSKSEVRGTGSKPYKQKGTGRARVGIIRNPSRVSGGTAFGPKPRDYDSKLNKKVKRLARKSALTYKAKDNNIIVLEDFTFDTPKTKEYSNILNNLEQANSKTLMVLPEANANIILSSNNLKKAKVVKASNLCTYDIMNANTLLILEGSVKEIEETLKK